MLICFEDNFQDILQNKTKNQPMADGLGGGGGGKLQVINLFLSTIGKTIYPFSLYTFPYLLFIKISCHKIVHVKLAL